MKRSLAIVVLATLSAAVWPAGEPARAAGPAKRGAAAAKPTVLPVPAYSQRDPAWANDRIGGSNERIKKVGCVVTSVAMTFSFFGIPTTPKQLNEYLKQHRGYDRRGWLSWQRAAEYTERRLHLVYSGPPSRSVINAHLAKGRPVITKTRSWRGTIHWVLIVGRQGREYLVLDPLKRKKKPVRMSLVARKLLSARVYAPTPKKAAAR